MSKLPISASHILHELTLAFYRTHKKAEKLQRRKSRLVNSIFKSNLKFLLLRNSLLRLESFLLHEQNQFLRELISDIDLFLEVSPKLEARFLRAIPSQRSYFAKIDQITILLREDIGELRKSATKQAEIIKLELSSRRISKRQEALLRELEREQAIIHNAMAKSYPIIMAETTRGRNPTILEFFRDLYRIQPTLAHVSAAILLFIASTPLLDASVAYASRLGDSREIQAIHILEPRGRIDSAGNIDILLKEKPIPKREVAKIKQQSITAPYPNRGILLSPSPKYPKALGILKYTKHPATLLEWCFINNDSELAAFRANMDHMLRGYAEDMARYANSKGVTAIILDPGHGGNDTGAANKTYGIKEKDMNLIIAKKLFYLFNRLGFNQKNSRKVVLTRTGDYYVGINQRCKAANQETNAFVISIHLNSSPENMMPGSGFEAIAYGSSANGLELARISIQSINRVSSIMRSGELILAKR